MIFSGSRIVSATDLLFVSFNRDDFRSSMYLHVIFLAEILGGMEDLCPIFYNPTYIVGHSTIGKRNMVPFFKNGYLRIRVLSANLGSNHCPTTHSANDDNSFWQN